MRSKPIQMALLRLDYEHQMIVNGEDTQLRLELPGVDVAFPIDPVTLCIEAVLSWHGRISRDEAGDALHYLVQIEAVVGLHRLFGAPDYFMRVAVADLEAYEHCLVQKVQAIPGIAKASSRLIMKVLKSTRP